MRSRRAERAAALLAAETAFALGGCGAEDGATVEVDLFSGRENPSFTLDADQEASQSGLLDSLDPVDASPAPEGLDFRGFLVSTNADGGADGEVYRVLPGLVVPVGTTEGRADPGDLASELLLQAAEGELSDRDRGALVELTAAGD